MSEGSCIRIVFKQKGPGLYPKKNDFSLDKDPLSEILSNWENEANDLDIDIYIDGVLSTKNVIGASNAERIYNLLIFLKTYWEKNPILLKDGNDFRKIISEKNLFSKRKKI